MKQYPFLDYLRSTLILLIVLEHAVIAYTSFAEIHPTYCYFSSWLIQDNKQASNAWNLLRSIRISFAIPLLFFISGIFVPMGIQRWGVKKYFFKRLKRLGIPLLFMGIILAPASYYLPCLIHDPSMSFYTFMSKEFPYGYSLLGPAWFLWTLLIFDSMVCFLEQLTGTCLEKANQCGQWMIRNPKFAVFLWIATVYLGYLIGASLIHEATIWFWDMITGPFFFTAPELWVDWIFFMLGISLSTPILNNRLPWNDYPLAWFTISMVLIITQWNIRIGDDYDWLNIRYHADLSINMITTPLLTVTLSLSFLSLFSRYAYQKSMMMLGITKPSFAIYTLHFPCVLWLEYGIRSWPVSNLCKIAFAFFTTVLTISIGYYGLRWLLNNRLACQITQSDP